MLRGKSMKRSNGGGGGGGGTQDVEVDDDGMTAVMDCPRPGELVYTFRKPGKG